MGRVVTTERSLSLLLLEDSAADAELVVEALRRSGLRVVAERADTEAAFVAALERCAPDVVLSDSSLGAFDPPEAMRVLRARRPGTPLIVVTGAVREGMAVSYLRAGAEDLVWKENLGRLAPVLEESLRVRQPLERLSPRQLDVFRSIAEGRSTATIALELKVSVKTVETHRAEVMRRLQVRDLSGLVRYALRIGLLAADAGAAGSGFSR
jgi:DNA-binding NarL/FixJ family response regulator